MKIQFTICSKNYVLQYKYLTGLICNYPLSCRGPKIRSYTTAYTLARISAVISTLTDNRYLVYIHIVYFCHIIRSTYRKITYVIGKKYVFYICGLPSCHPLRTPMGHSGHSPWPVWSVISQTVALQQCYDMIQYDRIV